MPQYLVPGVYVEEVPSGIKPISGVGTSTAGFVGVVADDVTMPAVPGRFQRGQDGAVTLDADGRPVPERYPVAPALTPQLVTSWEGWRTRFGDIQAGNLVLAHAVYGFFNNGGSRCFIVNCGAPTGRAGSMSWKRVTGATTRSTVCGAKTSRASVMV